MLWLARYCLDYLPRVNRVRLNAPLDMHRSTSRRRPILHDLMDHFAHHFIRVLLLLIGSYLNSLNSVTFMNFFMNMLSICGGFFFNIIHIAFWFSGVGENALVPIDLVHHVHHLKHGRGREDTSRHRDLHFFDYHYSVVVILWHLSRPLELSHVNWLKSHDLWPNM